MTDEKKESAPNASPATRASGWDDAIEVCACRILQQAKTWDRASEVHTELLAAADHIRDLRGRS